MGDSFFWLVASSIASLLRSLTEAAKQRLEFHISII